MDRPWLSIIGLGEDGLPGLTDASLSALKAAEIVFGGPRHLDLAQVGARGQAWPVPFDITPVLERRGSPTAILASGDPFWYGAGGSLAAKLDPGEWHCFPAPSSFSLIANRLGWRLEEVTCLGLHAAPFERLRPKLYDGARLICLLRDAQAPAALANWLNAHGFGQSDLYVVEAIGGSDERLRRVVADAFDLDGLNNLVAVAVVARGQGLPKVSGLPDDAFEHEGQITKRPIRAITMSTLVPRPGEHLLDIGGGSGSISVEWCLAGGTASTIEPRADRVAMIRNNASAFGVEHLMDIYEGRAQDVFPSLKHPDAVFVGGGASTALFEQLMSILPKGARLVANAVTLETEALLTSLQAQHGGQIMRIEIAQTEPLGPKRGWAASRPVIQWSVTL